ncbi:hypothetical protein SeMB42_g04036 [Synchytrium endobioticum]|uniref:Protein kinase domain-containing protein n=1 Tax=Synchytrium endobioticum TaxID=286115 RepID=A0A507CVH1_9FUNG|nr:hypothetical protein SeLEV6574_g05188 [Synchytrium endobioticum]TPX45371.1 hypothetical protein SeMB42_g04036 [Synchytrium endobioticum]
MGPSMEMQQITSPPADVLGLSALCTSSRSQPHQVHPDNISGSSAPSSPHLPDLSHDEPKLRTRKCCCSCLSHNPFTMLYYRLFDRDRGEERIRVRIDRRGSRTVVRTRLLNSSGHDEETAGWDEDLSLVDVKVSTPQAMNQMSHMSSDEELNHVMTVFEKAIQNLPPGLEKYVWIGILGWGGNGFVAEALREDKPVAVKFITRARVDESSLVPNDKIPAGIPLEAEIIRRVRHPNIVGFIDIFADDTLYYLVITKAAKLTWRLGPQRDNSQAELALQPRNVRRHVTPRESLVNDKPYKRPTNPAIRDSVSKPGPTRDSVVTNTILSELSASPLVHSSLSPILQSHADSLTQSPTPSPTTPPNQPPNLLLRPRHSHQGDLLDFLQQYGKTPRRVIRHIIMQIVSAYQALLNQGFLYLDFRPENIVIDDSFHITLVDFGMSQPILTNDDELFTQYGTLEASSPEILAGEGYRGFEADIWALGLVFYLICSGGEDALPAGTYFPGMIIKYPSEMEQEYRDLISKMLEVDPTKRVDITTVARHVKSWST